MKSAYLLLPDKTSPERIHSIVLGYDRSELASEVLRISRIVASSLDVDVIAVEAVDPDSRSDEQFLAFEPAVTEDWVQLRWLASRTLLTVAQARDASLIAVGSH